MIQFIYRIYVPESVPAPVQVKIRTRLTNFFDGYTSYDATGSWMGEYENTTVYEVICRDRFDYVMESITKDMLDAGEKEVLITADTITRLVF